MTEVTGRCYCGAVRFKFAERPITTRMCWCRDCQYLAAGNASVNAIFSNQTFEVAGETKEYVSTADSGNTMRRRFCPNCGTPLFSEASDRPGVMVVRVGTLDDPAVAKPASTIWTASAPAWAHIDDSLPMTKRQPQPTEPTK